MTSCYNKQPVLNLKCIVLTIILASGYWFLPRNSNKKWIAIAIGLVSIISLYLYDKVYACSSNKLSLVKWVCISMILVALYWYLKPNKWILLLFLFLPYLVLAWYDYIYSCKRNLGPTYLSLFYAWAKPSDSQQIKDYKNWCPDIKKKVYKVDIVVLICILILAPFYLKWKPKIS